MTIEGYLRLFAFYKWKILSFVLLAGILAFAASSVLLTTSPKYVSSVDLTLLPESSELSFVRGVLGGTTDSQFNAINKTVAETIYSRPVMLKAIKIVASEKGASGSLPEKEGGAINGLITSLKTAVTSFSAITKYLNSGSAARTMSAQDAQLEKYRSAVVVENVEGSLVIRIRATLEDPNEAAALANALAEAYVEQAGEQSDIAAQRIGSRFEALISRKQEELSKILEEEFLMRKQVGSLAPEEQRQSLARTLEAGRDALTADVVENEQLKIRLAYAEERRQRESQRDIIQRIDTELYATRSQLEEIRRRIEMRQNLNADLQKRLTLLAENEQPFLSFKTRQAAAQQEIDELRRMSISPAVSGTSGGARIKIINRAIPPAYPDSPKVLRNTGLGLTLGLLLAAIAVVFLVPLREMRAKWADTEQAAPMESRSPPPTQRHSDPVQSVAVSRTRTASQFLSQRRG
jgi:capsular polysaccharide biosynthesis protein